MNNQFKGHQRFNHCPRPPFNSLESTPNLFQLLTLLPSKRHNSHELSDCDRNNDNCTVHPDKLRGFNEIHRPARSRQNKDVGYGTENGRRSPLQFHGIPREQFYSERVLHERTTPGRPWRRQWTGSNRHAGTVLV